MAQIFHPSTNTIARVTIYAAVLFIGALAWTCVSIDRSEYTTKEAIAPPQPVPFSHEHHTAGLGIDCRYCHTYVETERFAGMPSTATCMSCHRQIWTDSDLLAPVRESFATGKPLRWTRVNDLPDYVYFNHSIHLAKGIGCSSCHGPVQRSQLMRKSSSLKMEQCLACHRDPTLYLRPKEAIFDADYAGDAVTGARLLVENHIRDPRTLTNCSVCHR